MKKEIFGLLPDKSEAMLFSLKNKNGVVVKITNFGGIVTSISVPDKNGNFSDIVLGFDNLNGYVGEHPYFGALIGRFANRIAGGQFTLNDITYSLAKNDGENHLHGGKKGFDKVLWDYEVVTPDADNDMIVMQHFSENGDENYPGNMFITVYYSLNNQNEFKIEYRAETNKETIINLTNHTYFNLSGEDTILNHKLQLYADKFTPIDSTLIPTGEIRSVEGSPLDFRKFETIGKRINDNDDQLKYGNGYDHNFILNNSGNELKLAAEVIDPLSGRKMEVLTTQPAIQFYSGNFLDGTLKGKNGKEYIKRGGLCLETQHYPDSPNKPDFPSVILKRGEKYRQITIFRFGII